jgi:Spy/CpxP family protein refolding chaperone
MRVIMKSFLTLAAAVMLMQPMLYAGSDERKVADPEHFRDRHIEDRHIKGHSEGLFGDPVRIYKKLGLSDEQVKNIVAINKEYAKKVLNYREKLAPKHIQLKKMFLEDNVDIDKVKSLLKEIADLRVDLHVLRIQQWLDIEKLLTPEQKAKIRLYRMHKINKGRRMGPEDAEPMM